MDSSQPTSASSAWASMDSPGSAKVWQPGQSGNSARVFLPSVVMIAGYRILSPVALWERHSTLTCNAFECADRQILLRVRHGDAARLGGVAELVVGTTYRVKRPPVLLEPPDHRARRHGNTITTYRLCIKPQSVCLLGGHPESSAMETLHVPGGYLNAPLTAPAIQADTDSPFTSAARGTAAISSDVRSRQVGSRGASLTG